MRCPHVTSCYWGEAQLKRTATACCAIASYDVPPNIDEVREDIVSATTTTPTPNPSPQGSEFEHGLEKNCSDFNLLNGIGKEPSSADCI
jgi:hypothetical protein